MRSPRRLAGFLALLVVLTLAPWGRAVAQDDDWQDWYDDAPPAEAYEDSLSPYGTWMDGSPYGRVWVPRTGYGWRPYWDGQWVWSSWGWTWTSVEPWAWTYHLGRWSHASPWGWVWVPGYTWGPAWVDFMWGDGYVGWAPIGYGALGWNDWIFVRDRHFCSPRVRWNTVDWNRLPPRLRGGGGRYWTHGRGRGPDREDIRRVAERPIRVHQGRERPRDAVPPWQRDGRRSGRRGDDGRGAARGDVDRRGPDWRDGGSRLADDDAPAHRRGPGRDRRGGRDDDGGGRGDDRDRGPRTSVPTYRGEEGPARRWRAPQPPLPGPGSRGVPTTAERGGPSGRSYGRGADGDGVRAYGRGSSPGAESAPRHGGGAPRGSAPSVGGGMRGGGSPSSGPGVSGGGARGGRSGSGSGGSGLGR